MKVTTITCEHTRQVRQFEPVRFSITAELGEKDSPVAAAKELQRLVLMICYKDDVKQRDHLIASLVDCMQSTVKEVPKQTIPTHTRLPGEKQKPLTTPNF